jgi:predicted signal transduction protein with EAL and GGDEF domain
VLARFGGDEFIVATICRDSTMNALSRGNRRSRPWRPFFPESHDIYLTASAGISPLPQDGDSTEILLQKSSLAMARAKKQKGNTYELFTEDMNELIHERLRAEGNLRRGIQRQEFLMYFQPKIVVGTGAVAGAEALMRWKTSDGTIISPAHFIPLAEEIARSTAWASSRCSTRVGKRLVFTIWDAKSPSASTSPRTSSQTRTSIIRS